MKKISPPKFSQYNKLNEGYAAIIYKHKTKNIIIKIYKKRSIEQELINNNLKNSQKLNNFIDTYNCENLQYTYGYFSYKKSIGIMKEYKPGIPLHKANLDLKSLKKIYYNVISLLQLLNENEISHTDIHHENILIDKETNIFTLIDFDYPHSKCNEIYKLKFIYCDHLIRFFDLDKNLRATKKYVTADLLLPKYSSSDVIEKKKKMETLLHPKLIEIFIDIFYDRKVDSLETIKNKFK